MRAIAPHHRDLDRTARDPMTTALIIAAIYFAVPTLGILICGRKLIWQGWLLFLLIWPPPFNPGQMRRRCLCALESAFESDALRIEIYWRTAGL